jgi:hypothetical protein
MRKISFILTVKDTEGCTELSVGPDKAVGTGIRYGLVRGSNPAGGEIFRTCPERSWAHPASYKTGSGSFQEIKGRSLV